MTPKRYPETKNAVSRQTWPLDVLPPFAIGPHYLLSRDCVEFITANKRTLRAVGTLEDVSIALWMLALQVKPRRETSGTGCEPNGLARNTRVTKLKHPDACDTVVPNLEYTGEVWEREVRKTARTSTQVTAARSVL